MHPRNHDTSINGAVIASILVYVLLDPEAKLIRGTFISFLRLSGFIIEKLCWWFFKTSLFQWGRVCFCQGSVVRGSVVFGLWSRGSVVCGLLFVYSAGLCGRCFSVFVFFNIKRKHSLNLAYLT